MKLLALGGLALSVGASKPNSGIITTLWGPILPKLACEVFYAPLVASSRADPPLASGVAWLHLNREGDLIYNVQVKLHNKCKSYFSMINFLNNNLLNFIRLMN